MSNPTPLVEIEDKRKAPKAFAIGAQLQRLQRFRVRRQNACHFKRDILRPDASTKSIASLLKSPMSSTRRARMTNRQNDAECFIVPSSFLAQLSGSWGTCFAPCRFPTKRPGLGSQSAPPRATPRELRNCEELQFFSSQFPPILSPP